MPIALNGKGNFEVFLHRSISLALFRFWYFLYVSLKSIISQKLDNKLSLEDLLLCAGITQYEK